jgi:hypothetical protein
MATTITGTTIDVGPNKLVANSAGNVGIGTASPAKPLDVTGDIRTSTGILFGTDTAAANTLDDYEEGTWNPNYDNNSNTLSASYSEQSGSYTKIGRTVFISGVLSTSSLTRSGTWIKLEGLPYSVSNSGTNANGGLNVSVANDFAGDYPMSGYASLTHSFILQYRSTSNASTSFLQDGDMSTSGENKIIFSGFYFTDS